VPVCDPVLRRACTTADNSWPRLPSHSCVPSHDAGVHQHALGLGTRPQAPAAGAVGGADVGGAWHGAAHAPPHGVRGTGAAATSALGRAHGWC